MIMTPMKVTITSMSKYDCFTSVDGVYVSHLQIMMALNVGMSLFKYWESTGIPLPPKWEEKEIK